MKIYNITHSFNKYLFDKCEDGTITRAIITLSHNTITEQCMVYTLLRFSDRIVLPNDLDIILPLKK